MAETLKRVMEGTHRAVPPEETWARIAPLLSRMGITRIADITGLDTIGIPVFQSIRPNSRTLSVSQGKGITPELARVSAAMEAIEFWHAEETQPLLLSATVEEMYPRLHYSVLDLARPVRSLLSQHTRLQWVEAKSLDKPGSTWLPWSYVHLDFTDPARWRPPILSASSIGLASGNTRDEALLHGLYESLERHAKAQLGRQRSGTELDLATVGGISAELLDRFSVADVKVRVHDATAEAGLPCYEVLIWSPDLPVRFVGWGCHRYADVALSRALTEAAQSRLMMIAGTRDDVSSDSYDWVVSRPRLNSPFRPSTPGKSFPNAQCRNTGIEEDLEFAVNIAAEKANGSVFWVDLTSPDFGIPVVKVVTPGLAVPKEYR